MPGHGKVDRDGIALLDAERFKHVCDTTNFGEELAVRYFAPFTRFIGFIDNCSL